jgi:hypothetical protein
MYRGIDVCQFGWKRATYDMPACIKGGRNEVFEPIQDVYENINGELLPQEKKFRFIGEYEFSTMPSATLSLLLNVYNSQLTMMWAPHKDFSKIAFAVLATVEPQYVNGVVSLDGLKMTVRSVFPLNKIPDIDNLYYLTGWPRMCSVKKMTAGTFVTGKDYAIEFAGTTDFTLIGSADNVVGTTFTCTGAGSGTGVAWQTN